MRTQPGIHLLVLTVILAGIPAMSPAQKSSGEWPRVIEAPEAKIVVYQPQIESFDQITLAARAAVSVTQKGKEPVFGAVWFEAKTEVDREARLVTAQEMKMTEAKFPDATPEQLAWLKGVIEKEFPLWGKEMSYDDLVAGLAVVETEQAASEKINTAPPEVIFASTPSVLITIDGEPIIKEVEGTPLKSVVNTPFFIVQDPSTTVWYLKGNESWYYAAEVMGPWNKMKYAPPKAVSDLAEKNVSRVPEDAEKPPVVVVPDVIIRTKPAELVQCDGEPKFQPVKETTLLYVENTETAVLMDIDTQQYYILLAGRWYQSKSLEKGPWTFVPGDRLPADFTKIPAEGDLAAARASIPGTQEAQEAVLENQIPQTAAVDRKTATVDVKYDGDPKFDKIEGTEMSYAVNTDKSVLLIGGRYYCCDQAIWFESDQAAGPWAVSTKVPAEVQSIPPESPVYNVKYVYIYDTTPEVVYVGYTPAYYGSYVYGGCVVYGTGYYYNPWYGHYYYPRPVTYGYAVHYNPYAGWGFSYGMSYGWFHMSMGTYGGYWGAMGYHHGYNHGYNHGYHHGYNRGYGAGYGAGYRAGQNAGSRPTPYTNNAYKKRDTGVKSTKDRPAQQPARGGNTASTRPAQQPNSKVKPSTKPNNVYADKSGNVYRKDGDNWQSRDSKGNWSSSDKSRPSTSQQPSANRPQAQPNTKDLNSQYQARERSSQRQQSYSKQSSRPSGGRSGGGGRRR